MHEKLMYNGFLATVLNILRFLLWIAIASNIAIEVAEVYLQKDVYHLALSAIFFLFAKMQIGISELLLSMNDEKASRRLFYYSMFMTCAAIIEIIDLGIDRLLTSLARTEYVYAFKFVSVFEFALGSLSTILAGYSLDRFFKLMAKKATNLAKLSCTEVDPR